MDQDSKAEAILRRFSSAMGLAVSQVLRDRRMEANDNLRDELEQEARILVVTYAGITRGWQSGKLRMWTALAGGDEEQVRLLMTKQLRLALSQIVRRQQNSRVVSLDAMLENGADVAAGEPEGQMTDRIDNRTDARHYRELYPTLAKNVFDGKTQAEIADEEGVTTRTVERHIAREKRDFLAACVRRRGVQTEGDETIEELAETYENLTAGRPRAASELRAAA